jgi:HD-GYP domain-containing protein (c-di-GMP phosphodiesterase class II)
MRQRIEGPVANVNYLFVGVRRDGAMIDVEVHGTRATHDDRPAIIGLLQDISEKKRAAEQVQRYLTQLESAFQSTVEVATTLSEMRDPYTAGHERRVGKLAAAIGTELGFDDRRIEGLRIAGYLHDIGKITIPAEILSKPGKLTQVEFQLIQVHPRASFDVLKDVEFPWPIAEVALQHHERMDGSGYPQGLKGDAILLDARILAVADVIEAMSSHRPYRAGLGIDAALAEIERGNGSRYDADVADACLRLFRERNYQLPL